MKSKPIRSFGFIVDNDGNLNVELVRAQIQSAFMKGLKEAQRTGSKTITIIHETDPFIEFGTKMKKK